MAGDYFNRVCGYPNTKIKLANSVSVEDLWKRRFDLAIPHKKWKLARFYETFAEITEELNKGHEFSKEEMRKTGYWDYLRTYHPHWMRMPLNDKVDRQIRYKFRNGIELFHDIKKRGMISPLDMIVEFGREMLYRGYRRLVILKTLNTPIAQVRYAIVYNNAGIE